MAICRPPLTKKNACNATAGGASAGKNRKIDRPDGEGSPYGLPFQLAERPVPSSVVDIVMIGDQTAADPDDEPEQGVQETEYRPDQDANQCADQSE